MLYLKAIHIIFIVTWFSGLFYMVRLFVYHSEANEKPEPEKSILINHFLAAEKRLWYGITVPSAYGTIIFGLWLSYDMFGFHFPDWLLLKLGVVLGLLIYHLICGKIFKNFQKGQINYSSMQMRIWNEVSTIFLTSIVFIVVLKDMLNWLKGLAGIILFSILLMSAIKTYKTIREKK